MEGKPAGKAAWETLQTVVVALLLALLIRQFVIESFVIQGSSMEPTFHPSERVLVNKFLYRFHAPRIGDVIIFLPPRVSQQDFIKRVVAFGGQKVQMRDGQVYVDDQLQPEPYLPGSFRGHGNFPAEVVPAGDVFVLGDNRQNSEDSRYFGFVSIGSIRGKAMVVWWPPSDARTFP